MAELSWKERERVITITNLSALAIFPPPILGTSSDKFDNLASHEWEFVGFSWGESVENMDASSVQLESLSTQQEYERRPALGCRRRRMVYEFWGRGTLSGCR